MSRNCWGNRITGLGAALGGAGVRATTLGGAGIAAGIGVAGATAIAACGNSSCNSTLQQEAC